MENDNETVEHVYEEMKEVTGIRRFIDSHYCNHCGDQIDGEGSALDVYADRILAAHKREMNALAEQKTAEAHEAFCKNAELGDAIMAKDRQLEAASEDAEAKDAEIDSLRNKLAAKDSMIAEQSAVNESQATQLRDALNECEELKCAIADSKRISDAVVKSLRDKNLEMAGEIAAKDAEIKSLRALVKEMADATDNILDIVGNVSEFLSLDCGSMTKVEKCRALVAKAREVVK